MRKIHGNHMLIFLVRTPIAFMNNCPRILIGIILGLIAATSWAVDQPGTVVDLGDSILLMAKSVTTVTDPHPALKTLIAPKRSIAVAVKYEANGPTFYFASNGVMVSLNDKELADKAMVLIFPALEKVDKSIRARVLSNDGMGAESKAP